MELVKLLPWLVGAATIVFLVYAGATNSQGHRKLWLLPAALSLAFLGWSIWAIATEGLLGFWAEHTRNKWGNQIWFDLLFAIAIGWWLIAPQARAMGMRIWMWLLLIVCTGCIGFLAMMSRYLYLKEAQAVDRS